MSHPAEPRAATVQYRPGRKAVRLAVLLTAAGWLAALGGLVGTIRLLPDLSWPGTIFPLLLCGSSPSAWWATRRAAVIRRLALDTPDALLAQRQHGDLSAIAESDRRPLRPIGATAGEIAERTDAMVAGLTSVPNMRIFRGIRPACTDLPPTSHAVSAGRTLVLVESVAWPPGWYRIDADGRVHCDGQYIGQSVRSLVMAIRCLQRLLPRSHRVSGLVVVYRTGGGRYALPTTGTDLAWTLAENAAPLLLERLARDRVTVSRHIVAALATGVEPQAVTR